MKKFLIIGLLCAGFSILTGCTSQEQVDELQGQIYDLESEVNNLKETIDQCNSNIEDAQSYAGSDYEDMEYALESLETCYY